MRKKIIIVSIILLIIAATVGITALINSRTSTQGPVSAYGLQTTTLAKPTDGSTIEDYDSLDNLAIIAGIMTETNFHSVTEGEVTAKVAFINYTQDVYNIRTIIDNEGFQQAISTSTLKSVAIQKYFDFDAERVLIRDADKINGKNTTWSDSEPTVYSNSQYLDIYGWLPNQISSYILCEETILEISEVTLREDGYYEITMSLDPSTAPAYYQYEVKAYGGASDYPSFSSIDMTVIFDSDWGLYQILTQEVYDINMPVIGSITCTSNMTETFTYTNLSITDKDYYDQYDYLTPSEEVISTTSELTATDYLMYAFGSYLNGDTLNLNVELNLNNNNITGVLSVDLVNGIYAFTSNDLEVVVKGEDVYLKYGSIKLKANISDVMEMLDLDLDLSSSIDTSDLLSQIGDSTIVKDGNNVTMISNLSLLGLEIPIEFSFTVVDETNITLENISTNITYSDLNISLSASICSDSITITEDFTDYLDITNLEFLVDDIKTIIENQEIALEISFETNDITIIGDIYINFKDDLEVSAILNIKYQDLSIPVELIYLDDYIYLDISDTKLSLQISKLLEDIDLSSDVSLNDIIDVIFSIDFKTLLNNINISEDKLDISLNLSDFDLSDYTINIVDTTSGFDVLISELGLNIKVDTTLRNNSISVDSTEYVDVTNILEYQDLITELFSEEYLKVNLSTTINIDSIDIPIDLNLNIDMNTLTIYGVGKINLFGYSLNLEIELIDDTIYLKIGDNLVISLTLEELLSYFNQTSISNVSNSNIDLTDLLKSLEIDNIDDSLVISLANLSISGINLNDTTITLSKGESFVITTYEDTLGKEDLDNLIDIVSEIIEVLNNGNINVSGSYGDINFTAIIDSNFNIEAVVEISGVSLQLNYYNGDNSIYVTYNNIAIKTDIFELMDLVSTYFDLDIDTSSLDLNTLISDLTISEKTLTITILGMPITISTENNLSISVDEVQLTLTNTEKEVSSIPTSYIALSSILPYLDLVLDYVDNNYLNVSLSLDISYNDLTLKVIADINVNITDLVVEGIVQVGDYLTLNISYQDDYIYLQIGNNATVKLSVEELMSYFGDVTLDTSSLDLNTLISNLTIVDNVLSLDILGLTISLEIVDNTLVVSLDDLSFENLSISNINVEISETSSFTSNTYEANLVKEDLDNLVDIVEDIIVIFNSEDNISLSGSYDDINFTAEIDKEFNIEAIIEISGVSLQLNYYNSDNSIYVTYNNIVIKTDIEELIEIINTYLDLDLDIDSSSINLNNIINSLVISKDYLEVEVYGYTITINTSNDIVISLNDNLNVTLSNTENEVSSIPTSYIALSSVLPYLDLVLDYVDNNYLNVVLSLDVVYSDIELTITADINVNITDLVVEGTIQVSDYLTLNILYHDNYIYLQIGNNATVRLSVEELMSYFGDVTIDTSSLNLNTLISDLTIADNVLSLDILGLNISLEIVDNTLVVSLDDLSFGDLSIANISASVSETSTFTPNTYEANLVKEDLNNLIDIVEDVIVIFSSEDNINLSGSYGDINLTAIIDSNFNIEATIEISGVSLQLNYYNSDNSIYVTYNNIVIKTDIEELIEIINTYFDLNLDIDTNSLDLNNIINSLVISEDYLEVEVYGYTITINTSNDVVISLNDNLNVTLSNTEKEVSSVPTSYIALSSVLPYLDLVLDYVDNNYLNVSLSLDISYNDLTLNVIADINVNITDLVVEGTIQVSDYLTLNILYEDNYIYLQIGNNATVKLSVEELMSYFGDVTLDTSSLDLNTLISNLTIVDNVLSLDIFGLNISLEIVDNTLVVSLDDLSFGDLSISNINVEVSETSSFTPNTYEANLVKEDLDNLIDIVEDIITIFNSEDNISLSGSYDDINFTAVIDKEFNIEATIEIFGVSLQLNYYNSDNSIYVTYNNIVIKTDIEELIEIINTYLDLDLDIDSSSINLNNIINSLVISKDYLEVEVYGYTITINTSNDIVITLNDNLNVTLSNTENEVSSVPTSHITLSSVLPYLDLVLDYVDNNYLNVVLSLDVVYSDIELTITADINVNITDLVVEGTIQVSDYLTLNILYQDNYIYLQIGNNATVKLSIEELMSYFGDVTLDTSSLDLNTLISNLTIVDNVLSLDILGLNISLEIVDNTLVVSLDDLSFGDLFISNVNVEISETSSFTPNTYEANLVKEDLDNLVDIVEDVISVLTSENNINISLNYGDIKGEIIINGDFEFSGVIDIYGYQINVNYIDNILYLNYGNIGVKGSLTDILGLIQELELFSTDDLNIDLDFNNLINNINVSKDKLDIEVLGYNISIDTSDNITLNVNDITINLSNTTSDIANILDVNYISISDLAVFVPSIKAIIQGGIVNLTLGAEINELSIEANIIINTSLDIYAIINVDDELIIYVSYNNEELTIKFNDNVVKTDISTIISLLDIDSNSFDTSISLEDVITGLDLVDNTLIITLFDKYVINVDSNLNISISDISISSINITNINITTIINNAEISVVEDEATITSEDLIIIKENIVSIIETLSDTFNLQLSTTLIAETTSFDVDINLNVNLTDLEISGIITFTTSAGLTHEIYVSYDSEYVSLSYGNLGVKLTIDELLDLINQALEIFNVSSLDTSELIDIDIFSIINSLVINVDESDSLNIALTLLEDFDLVLGILNNEIKLSDISVSNISLENIVVGINSNITDISIPNIEYLDYDSLSSIIDGINSILNMAEEEGLSFNIEGTISLSGTEYDIDGYINILFGSEGVEIEAEIVIGGDDYIQFYRTFENSKAVYYLIYGNSTASSTLNFTAVENDIMELLNTISGFLNFDFSDIEQGLEDIQDFDIVSIIDTVDFASLVQLISYSDNLLNILLNIDSLGDVLSIGLILDDNNSFSGLEIKNLVYSSINLSQLSITYTDTYNSEISVPDKDYYDLSMLNPMIKTVFNTAILTDFNISGTVTLTGTALGIINISKTINVEANIKRVDGSTEPVVYVKLSNIPIYSLLNSVSGYSSTDDVRTLEIYYYQGYVYMHRTENVYTYTGLFKKTYYDYSLKLKVTASEFISNIMYYLLDFGLGLSDTIMDSISGSMSTNSNIDYTNVITQLGTDESDNYIIGLNMEELTANSDLGEFVLTISHSEVDGVDYLSQVACTLDFPLSSLFSLTLSTSDLTLNNIGSTVDVSNIYEFVESYTYAENEIWEGLNESYTLIETLSLTTLAIVENKEDLYAEI